MDWYRSAAAEGAIYRRGGGSFAWAKASGFAESAAGPAESPAAQKGAVHVRLKQARRRPLLSSVGGLLDRFGLACGHVKARCARDIHLPPKAKRFRISLRDPEARPAAFREAPHVPAHSRPHRGYMERKGCGAVSPVLLWSRGRSCVAPGRLCCGPVARSNMRGRSGDVDGLDRAAKRGSDRNHCSRDRARPQPAVHRRP